MSSREVFAIEDNRDFLEMFDIHLSAAGFQLGFVAETKTKAMEGIATLEAGRFCAILLDGDLGNNEDSADLIPQIRARDKEVFVIGTSNRGRVPGVDDYLDKGQVHRVAEIISRCKRLD